MTETLQTQPEAQTASATTTDVNAAFYINIFKTFSLFFITAIMELLGSYFPYLMFNKGKSQLLWIPTAFALTAFVLLLSLHPDASGRIYASYGGIYVLSALAWIRVVDGVSLTRWDLFGGIIVLAGASLIILQPKTKVSDDQS